MNTFAALLALMLRNHVVGFFQQRWVQVLIAALFVMGLIALVHQHRSSYVTVALADAPGIPPDPGRKMANSTLLGVDSDNDGVRDDVQRYILALDVDHAFFKRALLQFAQALQTGLAESYNPNKARYTADLLGRAMDCASSAEGPDWYFESKRLIEIAINTKDRRSAYRRWNRYIPFMMQPSYGAEEACDFDIVDFSGERRR